MEELRPRYITDATAPCISYSAKIAVLAGNTCIHARHCVLPEQVKTAPSGTSKCRF